MQITASRWQFVEAESFADTGMFMIVVSHHPKMGTIPWAAQPCRIVGPPAHGIARAPPLQKQDRSLRVGARMARSKAVNASEPARA